MKGKKRSELTPEKVKESNPVSTKKVHPKNIRMNPNPLQIEANRERQLDLFWPHFPNQKGGGKG